MIIVRTPQALREALSSSVSPAFVPTMGNLHAGHMDLVRLAGEHGDRTVASIFVNRLQFLPHEDFDSYPRTFEADCAKLEAQGCDVLFAPHEADLYPQPQTVKVHPDPGLADILEGQFRPGFSLVLRCGLPHRRQHIGRKYMPSVANEPAHVPAAREKMSG